jgi:hypothetical protein
MKAVNQSVVEEPLLAIAEQLLSAMRVGDWLWEWSSLVASS